MGQAEAEVGSGVSVRLEPMMTVGAGGDDGFRECYGCELRTLSRCVTDIEHTDVLQHLEPYSTFTKKPSVALIATEEIWR